SRRRHTRWPRDWSSDVCSSDLRAPTSRHRGARRGPPAGRSRQELATGGALVPRRAAVPERRSDGVRQVWEVVEVVEVRGGWGRKIGRASCRERGEEGEVGGAGC